MNVISGVEARPRLELRSLISHWVNMKWFVYLCWYVKCLGVHMDPDYFKEWQVASLSRSQVLAISSPG